MVKKRASFSIVLLFLSISMAISCGDDDSGTKDTYSVGGTVTGLDGTLVLQNNGGDDVTITADGAFTFATPVADGSAYNVTILTQPAGQTCSVAQATGNISGANITDVTVTCSADTYTVGGAVNGLDGTLVLQNNGGDDLTITADGAFTFATALADGSAYVVTVKTQPAGQTCSVAHATGTVSDANITDVTITCSVTTYTVGGSVTGLNGTLILQNNDGDDLTITADGPFTFATALADGSAYNVTILTQPAGQTCSVAHGGGTLSGTDITDVTITCSLNVYTVGGSVTGLDGTLVLQINGSDDLTITANDPFTFATAIAYGSAYNVTVKTQPAGQTCSVVRGTGTISGTDVTDVAVTCSVNTYTVGGAVTGLDSTLVLQNNGGDDLTITANGPFTFAAAIAYGSAYNVTVKTQPAGQTCSVARGTGTISSTDVTDVTITCLDTYTIGGTVTGLDGTLVLQNNGGDDLTISANGPFTFATAIAYGSAYNVTVKTQPAGQTCSVAHATGTVSGANITDVTVTCVLNFYTVGGAVTGLDGTLVLQNNGGDDLTISANGPFTFATPIAHNSSYEVTIETQPAGQICSVARGTGTISGTDVTDVTITCLDTYTIGGTVTGLDGTLVLQNNGGDDLTITANGPFTFATAIAHGSGYEVTVKTQPAGQTCSVAHATGTVSGADITNVTVTCVPNFYTVGGAVTGLDSTLVLQNNGGDDLTITANGPFTFATAIAHGSGYEVTIETHLPNQDCTVTNGSGTIDAANVTDIAVHCVDKSWTYPTDLTDNISPDGEHAERPQVAMDDNGNAIIVWTQFDGSNYQIFKAEYRNGQWTFPADLSDNINPGWEDASDAQVAMDDNGNAVIVWTQLDGRYKLFKAEYRNGQWSFPADLSDNINPGWEDASDAQVAMDDNGNAIIVWEQYDESNDQNQIFKAEYRNGQWSFPADLTDNISPDGTSTLAPQVAMDDNGNAIIVWYQYDGSNEQIFKAEYHNGQWTFPADLTDNISPDGTGASDPQVAMDDNGNAIIVWHQSDGNNYQIFKAEYRNGQWTFPADLTDYISPDGSFASLPQVAMDDNGNAIIVWHQSDGNNWQIFKAEYRNGQWTFPADLADNISLDETYVGAPLMAMDDNGNAIIVWYQYDGSNDQIFKSEYRNGQWTNPADLTDNISPDGTSTLAPQVAMDDNGNAIIVWQQFDGNKYQIFKAEYR